MWQEREEVQRPELERVPVKEMRKLPRVLPERGTGRDLIINPGNRLDNLKLYKALRPSNFYALSTYMFTDNTVH